MQSATEYENIITRHIEECASQYVQNIKQNLEKGEAENTYDADYPLGITRNKIVLGIDNSKFTLDNGLDDYDPITVQDCSNTTDLSAITPKVKSGSPKENATPYMTVTTPCVGKRPMKSMSNLAASIFTPDVNNNSTDNKSVKNKKNNWSYKDVKSQGRKRLSFSENKENVSFMTASDFNDGSADIKHNFQQPVPMDLKHLRDKNNFLDKCKFSVTKLSAECSENIIKDGEKCTLSEDDSKNDDKHCCEKKKCRYFIENSSSESKIHLRSFVGRNFYGGSGYLGTPTSGLTCIGNSFLSPESLIGKRLDFSKQSSVLKKTITKDFLSYEKKNITLNDPMSQSKVVVKKKMRVRTNTASKESMFLLSRKESPLQSSHQKKKSCNISLRSKHYCSSLNLEKRICKTNSVVNLIDNASQCKKVPRSFSDVEKDESVLTMDYQSPPPCKKCKVTHTQSLATPYPFMPKMSLNAPRKKRYSCRRSSPYCRRKLIKDFEMLQIQAELVDTPPGSPVVG